MRRFAMILCLAAAASLRAADANQTRDNILSAMGTELHRDFTRLKAPDFEPAYYMCFSLADNQEFQVWADYGAPVAKNISHQANGRADVRVGNETVDSSQVGDYGSVAFNTPLGDDPTALATAFWQLAEEAFQAANQRYNYKKAYLMEHADEKDRPDDFSREKPTVLVKDFGEGQVDQAEMEEQARKASALFKRYPGLQGAILHMEGRRERKYMVDSQGNRSAQERLYWQVDVNATALARDGAPIENNFDQQYTRWEDVPKDQALAAIVTGVLDQLTALQAAPAQEPYSGPAIFSGLAAGVFMHEVLGHRLECERQKDDREGQTFKEKLGKEIMPAFVSLYDDPSLKDWEGTPLAGFYEVDDEGQPARRADLVKDGKLVGFLMSRSPIKGFNHSNGHGRSDYGHRPCGRMGNLILESRRSVGDAGLVEALRAECRKRNKPYGLYFKNIQGGDTMTQKGAAQAFRGLPTVVTRIYAKDGREELVRGLEIVGTPLNALNKILATGKKSAVFNGVCGAASGWVPVSTVAPAMLVSEVEVQGSKDEKERPRILPPPYADDVSGTAEGK